MPPKRQLLIENAMLPQAGYILMTVMKGSRRNV